MKIILSIIMYLLVGVSLSAQQTVNQRNEIAAKGINKQIELRIEWENDDWSTDTSYYRFHEYDKSGNHVINGFYGADNQEYTMYLRFYDSLNRPILRQYFCDGSIANPKGKVCLYFQDYEFDYWGNVTQEVGYGEDSTFFVRVLFRRDSLGNPIERWDIYRDLTRNQYYGYTYNEYGDQVTVEIFNYLNDRISRIEFSYTYDHGRKTDMRKTNELNLPTGSANFSYDRNGNISTIVQFNEDGKPIRKRLFRYEYFK